MRAYSPCEREQPSLPGRLGRDRAGSSWRPSRPGSGNRRSGCSGWKHTTSGAPVLLWTDLGAGHGGPSGRYDSWRDEARTLAFIIDTVGSAAPAPR
ncbi:MAG: hypothetical protein R2710_17725 [Acidimicrobiales bacterium]